MANWRSILLGLGISVVTLGLALRGNDLSQLGPVFEQGRYLYLLPTGLFIIVGTLFRAWRWLVLLNNQATIADSFNILSAGNFLNAILPFRLGEVARGYLLSRRNPAVSFFTGFSSIVAERMIDLVALAGLVFLA